MESDSCTVSTVKRSAFFQLRSCWPLVVVEAGLAFNLRWSIMDRRVKSQSSTCFLAGDFCRRRWHEKVWASCCRCVVVLVSGTRADLDRLMNLGSLRISSNPISKWCAERQEGKRKGSHHWLRLLSCHVRDGQSCVASSNTICRESGQFNLVHLCHTNLILSGIHRQ